jgi:hypothetical protein
MALDATFFRRARRSNRAVEITDMEAVIPAVKDKAEIRVPLPNRRLRTLDERKEALDARTVQIRAIEEEIEVERKKLLELVKAYKLVGAGVPEVVVQNQKIKELMERRSALARPGVWIEQINGLTLMDVFESKRDTRKVADGAPVFQVKRRVEPITSLYVDVGLAAAQAVVEAEDEEDKAAQASAIAQTAQAKATVPKTAAQAAQGAIIGKRVITLKKKTPAP